MRCDANQILQRPEVSCAFVAQPVPSRPEFNRIGATLANPVHHDVLCPILALEGVSLVRPITDESPRTADDDFDDKPTTKTDRRPTNNDG